MSDPLRKYLRELRQKRHVSQRELAEHIGLSLRAFSDWETGKSEELKSGFLVRAMHYLGGSWDDLTRMVLESTGEQPESSTLEESELGQLIDQLQADPQLRAAVLIFWAGWKARKMP